MIRYTVQLFGVTVFALAMIWFATPGDAVQSSDLNQDVLWADTVHINIDNDSEQADETPKPSDRDSFLKDVRMLTQTAFHIRNQYMEEVNTEDIIRAGINGMLTDLDRFSVVLEKRAYDDLMESTSGKYSGLGMQIDARDDRIIIVSPIEGTPAYKKGLRAGDVIMKINDESTYKMSSADAAKNMRGEAGTSVKLTIQRAGLPEPLEFDVDRAVILLKSVNYSGMIPGTDIGYVRLSRFAEETSHELRDAINQLNTDSASALIFDLRSNGGGLLDQAKETAELFLQQGREIVSTRGRFQDSERIYNSERPPIFPDKPLIILVDQGTASASEIVAGAIQDWDRGLIVGADTYGKGLVQQIFQIANDGSMALKLTTAKYYVPSGRCIQKEEKQYKHPREAAMSDEDGEEPADSIALADREIFYTNGGRVVYGGGGIVPDIDVDAETWKPIEINLERKSMFFDFAIKYVTTHPDLNIESFEATPAVLTEFRQFLKENDFSYKSALQVSLEDMEKTVNDEARSDVFEKAISEMHVLVEQEKDRDFEGSLDYIKRAIRREIISSVAGERGVYEQIVLKHDKTVERALEILKNPGEYSKLIKEGQVKKAEL
jgi:carboxyl-terminal processing protease